MKKLVTIVCAMLMMAAFAIPTFAATTKDDIIAELKAGVQVGDKTKAIPEKYIDVAEKFFAANELTDEQLAEIKKYVINPVEAREASLDTRATLKMEYPVPTEVEVLDGFNELDEAGLKKFIDEKGLAMDLGDIKFCQEYFRSEQRDPTITEIR